MLLTISPTLPSSLKPSNDSQGDGLTALALAEYKVKNADAAGLTDTPCGRNKLEQYEHCVILLTKAKDRTKRQVFLFELYVLYSSTHHSIIESIMPFVYPSLPYVHLCTPVIYVYTPDIHLTHLYTP